MEFHLTGNIWGPRRIHARPPRVTALMGVSRMSPLSAGGISKASLRKVKHRVLIRVQHHGLIHRGEWWCTENSRATCVIPCTDIIFTAQSTRVFASGTLILSENSSGGVIEYPQGPNRVKVGVGWNLALNQRQRGHRLEGEGTGRTPLSRRAEYRSEFRISSSASLSVHRFENRLAFLHNRRNSLRDVLRPKVNPVVLSGTDGGSLLQFVTCPRSRLPCIQGYLQRWAFVKPP